MCTFLRLSTKAVQSADRSKGRITNKDNSGMVAVGIGDSVGELVIVVISGILNVTVGLQSLKLRWK